jgi:hypothetical protein
MVLEPFTVSVAFDDTEPRELKIKEGTELLNVTPDSFPE